MFHLAKVTEIMSSDEKGAKFSDTSTHALLEMWDENVLLLSVAPKISKAVKSGDFVLVDYSPMAVGGAPVPRHEVVAVLSEPKGKKLWARMKEYLGQKRRGDTDGESFMRDQHPGKMVG